MTNEVPNAYIVQSVEPLDPEKALAFVKTDAGGFLVETTPEVGDDARDAGILFIASSLEEAIEKYENVYG